jgi:hypothetical protein
MNTLEGWEECPIEDRYEDAQDSRAILFAGDPPRVEDVRRRIRIVYPHGLARLYRGEILGLHRLEA